ncbi:MAG TPA: nucleoside triphosphate pyrophosphatase [Allocoleopsis sp.]
MKLILASASPSRLKLLQNAGIDPVVCPSDFDESQIQLNDPIELVLTLAQKKAETVATKFPNDLVLGCDSVLVVNGQIHGKPKDEKDAIARWQTMRGKVGELLTGLALISVNTKQILVQSCYTKVYFAMVSDAQIVAYVNTQEPLNCAGCFALEGKGGLFIEKIEGCHSNVIGLSLPRLRTMMAELGKEITDFWEKKEYM